MISKEERKQYLKDLEILIEKTSNGGDYEIPHSNADAILCEILEKLGYKDIVDAYEEIGKWYA